MNQMNFFIFTIKMFTFSKNFQPKNFFRIKGTYFSKLFIKIYCFEKYIDQCVFYAIGGTPFPWEMFLFYIKLIYYSIFTILFLKPILGDSLLQRSSLAELPASSGKTILYLALFS